MELTSATLVLSFSPIFAAHQLTYPTLSNTSLHASPSLKSWGILLLVAVIWGSSYILIKKGLIAYSPTQLASLRVVISALAFLPVFIARRHRINWSALRYLLVVGFSGSFIPAFLFAFAQTQINSSTTGILSSLTPLFTLILGISFFGVAIQLRKVVGVIIGLAGAVFLILYGRSAGMEGNLWYGLLVVLGCACYALSVNTVKTYLQDMSAITISAVSFILIGIPAVLYLFTTDFIEVVAHRDGAWLALGYISILALLGTVAATVLFFKLVQITDAVFGSMVSYLIPLIAVLWGVVDGEVITLFHIIGMALILTGVYISRK